MSHISELMILTGGSIDILTIAKRTTGELKSLCLISYMKDTWGNGFYLKHTPDSIYLTCILYSIMPSNKHVYRWWDAMGQMNIIFRQLSHIIGCIKVMKTAFPGSAWISWQNVMVHPPQTHNPGKIRQQWETLILSIYTYIYIYIGGQKKRFVLR